MLGRSALTGLRNFSDLAEKNISRKVVVIRNRNVAAWHPEPVFPYEHTRPVVKEITEDQGVVRRSNRWSRGPSNVQLKNIFYTTKHEWFTRTREERLRSVAAPTKQKS
ncbi:Lpl-1p [Parelaphostrongylus tenuis]|uniref:Lpl-1p n=1 Tax=Parelaphostrongylus tenuis TaxID=148309 RepID=A0AAD5MST3_PARTN|nr:Lpl-1p [Parelaphostrongylus tenuis]